jgi:hypothetical protein
LIVCFCMINKFPDFSQLTIEHQKQIRSICSTTDVYADFNFINLFCWSDGGKAEVSILNGNLVIRLPDYISDNTIVSLIGNNKIDDSIGQLLQITDKLDLVPQSVIDKLEKRENLNIKEDFGGHDYIYKIENIVNFPGGKFKNKRQKLQSVKAAFPSGFEVMTKTKIDHREKEEVRFVFISWIENHRKHSVLDDAEFRAFNILLNNLDHFSLAFTFIKNGDQLVAFSVNEIINKDYALCHFEKVVRIHPQMGILIVNEAAKYLLNAGCTYMNWEQDLGIAGLRNSKKSYHPVKLFKKYIVSTKT